MIPVPAVPDAAHVPPLPLALKVSGAPRPMVRSRPLPGSGSMPASRSALTATEAR